MTFMINIIATRNNIKFDEYEAYGSDYDTSKAYELVVTFKRHNEGKI